MAKSPVWVTTLQRRTAATLAEKAEREAGHGSGARGEELLTIYFSAMGEEKNSFSVVSESQT